MEALTQEQLAEIMADPRLAAAYKSMQADYTRKTQGVADAGKRLADLESQLAEANDYLTQWEQYGSYADPIVKQFTSGQFSNPDTTSHTGNGGVRSGGEPRRSAKNSSQLEEALSRIDALEDYIGRAAEGIDASLGQLNKMFNYSVELNELQFNRFNETGKFDLDASKVLKTAMEKRLPSLKDAYDVSYKDEFVKTAAEKRAEEIYTERKAKESTEEGEHATTKRADTVFRFDPNRPKSFGEATEQALKEKSTPSTGEALPPSGPPKE